MNRMYLKKLMIPIGRGRELLMGISCENKQLGANGNNATVKFKKGHKKQLKIQ